MDNGDAPSMSVVVCTHNRPRHLDRCLTGLEAQTVPVEVIVVDSASQPSNQPVVSAHESTLPQLRFWYEDQPGLSRARNRGITIASHDLVAFLDDDACPHPTWAAELLRGFVRPDVVCVGGECVADFVSTRPRWLSDRLLALASITNFGPDARVARSSAEWPVGANLAFRRDALQSIGGFDEALGRTGTSLLSYEEFAVIRQLIHAGGQVWLQPSAVVDHTVHPERCTSRFYWRRAWWNGISRARQGLDVGLAARRIAAVPLYLAVYAVRRDRYFLYQLAESAGYFAGMLQRGITSRSRSAS